MKIRKKNGEVEQFDLNKLVESIVRASDATHEPLNMGDVDVITKDILQRIDSSEDGVISSEEVFDTTLLYLMKDRFYNVAEEYRKENQW